MPRRALDSLIHFQIYRTNLSASCRAEWTGPLLATVSLPSEAIDVDDTVETVCHMVKKLAIDAKCPIDVKDNIKLFFDNTSLQDIDRFYATPMLLPAYFQVAVFDCTWDEFVAKCKSLPESKPEA